MRSGAETRGYASEVIGCQVYPAAGLDEKYFYSHHRPYKNIQDWHLAGMVQDASFPGQFFTRERAPQLWVRCGLQEPGPGMHGG